MIKKIQIRWKVLFALSIILISSILIIPKLVYAVDESDSWVIPKKSYNARQKIYSTKGIYIVQRGTHPKGTSSVLYRTTGMYMTLNELKRTETETHVFDNVDKEYIQVKVENPPGEATEKTVVSYYKMLKTDFIEAVEKLGITSKQIKDNNGSVTVYMHNRFEIYNPNEPGKPAYEDYTNILGYKDMIDAGKRIVGNNQGWPDDTQEALKYYYNFPYVITPTIYNVEIHAAVDSDKGLIDLVTLKSGDTGMLGEKYPQNGSFTAKEDFTSEDGTKYKAKGYYFCRYTDRVSREMKHSNHKPGLEIKDYPLPDAFKDSKVIFYIAYEKVEDIKVIGKAVDKETGTVIKDDLFSDSMVDHKFTKPVPNDIKYNEATYTKTGEYTYEYQKSNGTYATEKGVITGDQPPTVSFRINDIKSKSAVKVTVYYEKIDPGDIPVTIIPIDKMTNKVIQDADFDLSGGTVEAGSTYKQAKNIPPRLQDEITSKAYTYSGSWDWSFQYNNASASTKITKGSGSVISFIAPPASDVKDKITVKVYYNPASNPTGTITLRVTMEALSGGTIKELSKETVTRNQSITKTAKETVSINGIVYKYQDKWAYEYLTSSGSVIKNGTGNTAVFKIPSDTNFGSIVELRLYYFADIPIPTPIPEDPIEANLDSPTPYGIIDGDKYGSRYFTSEQGISTTESQYVYVKTKDYLLGYKLVNKTGYVDYSVPVTVSYTLKYYTATPKKPKPVTEVVKDPRVVTVRKNYSYWEIAKLEYYTAGKADIYNYSLPGGSVTLNADSSLLDVPALSTQHSGSLQDHVFAPRQVTEGIEVVVSEPITSNTSNRPEIDYIDPTSYAIKETEEATVKNDYLSFDGYNILTNTTAAKEAPSPTNTSVLRHCSTITKDKALFTDGKVIKAEKENGIYSSNGNVIYYLHPESVNAYSSSLAFNVHVNSVTIHTPVICNPIISVDNSKWSQVLDPVDDAVQIVLDPDTSLNDFSVTISNTLHHSNRLGYYTRDFSRSFIDPENVSYIAKQNGIVRNEMKLPFDVYVDKGNDKNAANDEYIKAGTWIIMGRATARFYVPMWIQEGTYTAEFRTIAVNGTDRLNLTETTGNYDLHRYVATSQKTFQISGRIYGLNLYDISDYPKWKEAFRVKDTMLFKYFEGKTDGTQLPNYNSDAAYYYTVGTKNQYGISTGRYSQYTFPLVNGSHPRYKNLGVLKTGYAIRFLLNTTGEMYSSGCKVKITPTFYYVDANGKNRRQVDLYYNEEINSKDYPLVKMGQGVDLVNIKSGTTDNIYSRIPEREIAQTAAVMNKKYSLIANQRSSMYSYTDIRLMPAFRTFIGTGYAKFITGLASYKDVEDTTGLTQTGLTKYLQRWYGTYKLPTNVHAVPKGTDVWGYLRKYGIDYDEDFWLKDGYIIVNFNIVTIDKDGKKHLSYINGNNYLNHGNCSMWVTEGAPLQKTDNKGVTFNFKAGDFIIYYTDKKYSDDYEGNLY